MRGPDNMNVDELYRLAVWFNAEFPELSRLYKSLLSPLNHNASQPDKRPLEEQLNVLVEFLTHQDFSVLSLEQIYILSLLGVDLYIGHPGADYVNSAVRTSNYDPATAVQRLNTAMQAISNARGLLAAYAESVKNMGLEYSDVEAEDGFITIRIGFQNDAAINNVVDWKNSAREWHDIVRGLSMVCGEKPEDIKVIGAATGSIIMVLATTAAFATLLASISKYITVAARDIIEIQISLENLRQKKILTKNMELEFKKLEKETAESTISKVESLVEEDIKDFDGDIKVALSSSIKKLLNFSEKGGTVDFVAPEDDLEAEDDVDEGDSEEDGLHAALLEARTAIREYQVQREDLKLLSDGTTRPVG